MSSSKKKQIYDKIIGRLNLLDNIIESDIMIVFQQIHKNRRHNTGGMFWQTQNKIAYQAFFKEYYNPLYKKIDMELEELKFSQRPNVYVFAYSEELVNEFHRFINGCRNFRNNHLRSIIESLEKDAHKKIPKYESLNTIHSKPTKPTKPIIKPLPKPSPKKHVGFKKDDVLFFRRNKPTNNICKTKCNLQNKKGPFDNFERIKILECLNDCM